MAISCQYCQYYWPTKPVSWLINAFVIPSQLAGWPMKAETGWLQPATGWQLAWPADCMAMTIQCPESGQ